MTTGHDNVVGAAVAQLQAAGSPEGQTLAAALSSLLTLSQNVRNDLSTHATENLAEFNTRDGRTATILDRLSQLEQNAARVTTDGTALRARIDVLDTRVESLSTRAESLA